MKNLFISVIIISCFFSCKNQMNEVSTSSIDNKMLSKEYSDVKSIEEEFKECGLILKDESQISERLNATFQEQNVQISSFRLIKEEHGYSVLAANASGNVKSSLFLESVKGDGENVFKASGNQSDCTCSGCTDGCSPRRHKNGDCYCTDSDKDTRLTCVKTESIN